MSDIQKDFFEHPQHKDTRHIYTVSELTRDIKAVLESNFTEVWVEGEVSGLSRIATGTVFFSLKDNASLLKCVIFYSFAREIKFDLKDGMKIMCFGSVGVYEKDGKYQLYVERAEPKGVGSLQLALEQLKEKLEKEGLFSPEHKRPIPYLPQRIGVVTSLQGAAIRDILKVLNERFKDTHIIINPVRVQGEDAKKEIAQAIKDFNRWNNIDVMIVGRGGGSIEDLWAFNEEIVARAIYNSRIPIISAVGHERDWTLADLVADVRAPTPSVAAQMVIPRKEDLRDELNEFQKRLKKSLCDGLLNTHEDLDDLVHRLGLAMGHILELIGNECEATAKKLMLLNPAILIEQYRTKTIDLARQMAVRINYVFQLKKAEFIKAAEKLANLSPLNILARGYSITFLVPQGSVVKDASTIREKDLIKTRLHKGEVVSVVKEVTLASRRQEHF